MALVPLAAATGDYLENAAEVADIMSRAAAVDEPSDVARLSPPAGHPESPGWVRWLGWKLQLVTILLPVIILAIANNYGIHLVQRMHERMGDLEGVQFMDGGTLSFTLAEPIAWADGLIVVDLDAFEFTLLNGTAALLWLELIERPEGRMPPDKIYPPEQAGAGEYKYD